MWRLEDEEEVLPTITKLLLCYLQLFITHSHREARQPWNDEWMDAWTDGKVGGRGMSGWMHV